MHRSVAMKTNCESGSSSFKKGRSSRRFVWPVKHAKSSATVLAVRAESGGRLTDPHPMIAIQDYGLGKVLWLAHDEFWRMRKRVENLYYWRFWSGIRSRRR